MSNRTKLICTSIIGIILLAMPIMGQGFGDTIQIHGFASQGYLKSTGNNFLIKNSKDGSWEFSEAALTFLAMPSDRLRTGAQVFARDLGDEGNHELMIDWAYGDYRWQDFLGVRIGKIKSPLSMYNTIRDLDVARVPVLLPHGIYDDNIRDFNLSINGMSLYGNVPVNVVGDIDYELFGGDVSVTNPKSNFFKNVFYLTGSGIASNMMFIPGVLSATYDGTSKETITIRNNYGFLAAWNTPLSGLKVGSAMNQVKYNQGFCAHVNIVFPTADPNTTVTMPQVIPVTGDYNIKNLVYFGEFTWNNLILAGEYKMMELDGDVVIGGAATNVLTSRESYYGMASYRISDRLALSAYYSEFYPDIDDKKGDLQAGLGNPDYFAWQKEYCFTTRLDITSNWILKLEYHKINGAAQALLTQNLGGLEKDWSLFAVKSTFHF